MTRPTVSIRSSAIHAPAIAAGVLLLSLVLTGCQPSANTTDAAAPDLSSAAGDGVAPAELTEIGGKLQSESHVIEEIAPGIYFASATGKVNIYSNAMIVVNDDDILIVDSHVTPDAARGLIGAAKALSDNPIRFLVNSHFHFDHAHGNQAFADDVLILGHEYTRERLLGDVLNEATYQTIGRPDIVQGQVDALRTQLADADDATTTSLEAQINMLERHIVALAEVEPTPPNVTLDDKVTLHRGGREIQLLHLGRGHTGGDVVTYLPAEKIAFTGDLFYDGAPYLGDGYANEMVATLDALAALDWDLVVPGHGPLVTDRTKIDRAQTYLRTYWAQAEAAHDQGLSVEDAAAGIDFTGFEDYALFQMAQPSVVELEVRRMYELMDQ